MSFLFSQKPDSAIDHNSLANLTTGDPHTQYVLLAGRAGGQTLYGSQTNSQNLTLGSTSAGTKGKILFGTSAYDEVNNRLGIGTVSPLVKVHIEENNSGTLEALFRNVGTGSSKFVLTVNGASAGDPRFFFNIDGVIQWGFRIDNGDSDKFKLSKDIGGGDVNYLIIDVSGIISLPGSSQYIDLSAISAGNPNLKITATSDTPTVAFTGGGNAPTTAPAGYLEILVGASARYIPFWA